MRAHADLHVCNRVCVPCFVYGGDIRPCTIRRHSHSPTCTCTHHAQFHRCGGGMAWFRKASTLQQAKYTLCSMILIIMCYYHHLGLNLVDGLRLIGCVPLIHDSSSHASVRCCIGASVCPGMHPCMRVRACVCVLRAACLRVGGHAGGWVGMPAGGWVGRHACGCEVGGHACG